MAVEPRDVTHRKQGVNSERSIKMRRTKSFKLSVGTRRLISLLRPRKILMVIITVTIFLAQPVASPSAFLYAGMHCISKDYSGAGKTTLHRLDSGHYRCCLEITCPAGTFAVPCQEGVADSTYCEPCPLHTFQHVARDSSRGDKCEPTRYCQWNYGLIKIDNGTRERDAVCACDLERGYVPPPGETNPTYCLGPKPCPMGQELHKDDSCMFCKHGSFKSHNGTGSCHAWTNCEKQRLKTAKGGTPTTDAECEPTYDSKETSTETDISMDTSTETDINMETSTETGMIVTMSNDTDVPNGSGSGLSAQWQTALVVVAALLVVAAVVIIIVKYNCIAKWHHYWEGTSNCSKRAEQDKDGGHEEKQPRSEKQSVDSLVYFSENNDAKINTSQQNIHAHTEDAKPLENTQEQRVNTPAKHNDCADREAVEQLPSGPTHSSRVPADMKENVDHDLAEDGNIHSVPSSAEANNLLVARQLQNGYILLAQGSTEDNNLPVLNAGQQLNPEAQQAFPMQPSRQPTFIFNGHVNFNIHKGDQSVNTTNTTSTINNNDRCQFGAGNTMAEQNITEQGNGGATEREADSTDNDYTGDDVSVTSHESLDSSTNDSSFC